MTNEAEAKEKGLVPIGNRRLMPIGQTAITRFIAEGQLEVRTGHSNNVNSVAYSPDGRFLVSGSVDGAMRVWAAANGRLVATFLGIPDGEWMTYIPQGYYIGTEGVLQRAWMRMKHGQVYYDAVPQTTPTQPKWRQPWLGQTHPICPLFPLQAKRRGHSRRLFYLLELCEFQVSGFKFQVRKRPYSPICGICVEGKRPFSVPSFELGKRLYLLLRCCT